MPRPSLFPSLHGYRRGWLRSDLLAGLTVWAVLVPEALAYASIAGVSPVVGLYAAPGALLLYAALGSSRHLVTGPATAALSAATVGDLVAHSSGDFLAFTTGLAIATGLAALLAGILRLGFLASFISEPGGHRPRRARHRRRRLARSRRLPDAARGRRGARPGAAVRIYMNRPFILQRNPDPIRIEGASARCQQPRSAVEPACRQ